MLIFLLDTFLLQGFLRDQRNRSNLAAERLKSNVQSTLEEHVTALIALKVLYQNFPDITHYDFQQYGKSITSMLGGFQRLFYIDPSLKVRQVYPQTPENIGLYNYSLKHQGEMTQALEQAKRSQSVMTSRLIPFLNHSKSFWAIIPIYRSARQNTFLGYAMGEIDIDNIGGPLAPAFSSYQLQLLDPNHVRLFSHVAMTHGSPSTNISEFPLNPYGQSWTLLLKPVNAPTETLLLQQGSV